MLNIPQEDILWTGRPSHLTKMGTYLFCLIVFVAIPILAAVAAGWTAINIYYTRWILTEDTLHSRQNFFQGDYDTLWLYVIRDVGASRPLFYRLFGLGWVNLVTMDRTHPTLRIGLIPDAGNLKLKINEMARKSALDHETRVIDWGG